MVFSSCLNLFQRSHPCSSRIRTKSVLPPRTASWITLPFSFTDVLLTWGENILPKKKQKSQINYLRSHCLWRVFPRKSDEIKNLTELSYSLLLVFHVHRIGQLLNLERHDRHKLQEKITVTETWKPEKITSPLSSSFTPQNLWPSIIWKPHWPMLYILRIISYCDWYFQHIFCPER